MTHNDANTKPYMLNEINERVQSIAGCEDMFDIIPKRYLFDHTSPGSGGWFVLPALHSTVRILLFSRQPKLKGGSRRMREQGRETREGKRQGKRWGCLVHLSVHAYMRRPLDEFNHSHMRGHLS